MKTTNDQVMPFIVDLARRMTDELGFVPRHAYARDLPLGLVDIQLENNEPCGFLYHGPIRPGHRVTIYQTAIAMDARRRASATALVMNLIQRANLAKARSITLRCAVELDANLFWRAMEFELVGITPGGQRRDRMIAIYHLELSQSQPIFRT